MDMYKNKKDYFLDGTIKYGEGDKRGSSTFIKCVSFEWLFSVTFLCILRACSVEPQWSLLYFYCIVQCCPGMLVLLVLVQIVWAWCSKIALITRIAYTTLLVLALLVTFKFVRTWCYIIALITRIPDNSRGVLIFHILVKNFWKWQCKIGRSKRKQTLRMRPMMSRMFVFPVLREFVRAYGCKVALITFIPYTNLLVLDSFVKL